MGVETLELLLGCESYQVSGSLGPRVVVGVADVAGSFDRMHIPALSHHLEQLYSEIQFIGACTCTCKIGQ